MTVLNETKDVVLYLDHVRMAQERPGLLSSKRHFIHFGKTPWPGSSAEVNEAIEYTKERGYGWTASKSKHSAGGFNDRWHECG